MVQVAVRRQRGGAGVKHLVAPDGFDPTPEITRLTGHRLKTACGMQVDLAVWMQAKLNFGEKRIATANRLDVDCQKCLDVQIPHVDLSGPSRGDGRPTAESTVEFAGHVVANPAYDGTREV